MSAERGSASLELTLVTPAIVVLLLFAVGAGRLAQARAEVDAAARDAARAASIARSPEAASAEGISAAQATLEEGGVTCRDLAVAIDTAGFAPGGSVGATVTCTVDLGDLTLLRVPGSRTVSAHFVHPLDTYRGEVR